MQERFKQLLEKKNLTATRFAAVIKVNASAMSHILNGRSKPGFDVLDKIAQAFPDINLNWLISGKGSMFNQHSELSLTEPPQISEVAEETTTAPVEIKITNRKIKRIILFFEDGSFEDYEK